MTRTPTSSASKNYLMTHMKPSGRQRVPSGTLAGIVSRLRLHVMTLKYLLPPALSPAENGVIREQQNLPIKVIKYLHSTNVPPTIVEKISSTSARYMFFSYDTRSMIIKLVTRAHQVASRHLLWEVQKGVTRYGTGSVDYHGGVCNRPRWALFKGARRVMDPYATYSRSRCKMVDRCGRSWGL
jgi:hypothetical protein